MFHVLNSFINFIEFSMAATFNSDLERGKGIKRLSGSKRVIGRGSFKRMFVMEI